MPTHTTTMFDNREIQLGEKVWYFGNYGIVAAEVREVSTTGIKRLTFGSPDGDFQIFNENGANLTYDGAANGPDGLGAEKWMVWSSLAPAPTAALPASISTNGSSITLTTSITELHSMSFTVAENATEVQIAAVASYTLGGLATTLLLKLRNGSTDVDAFSRGPVGAETGRAPFLAQLTLDAGTYSFKIAGVISGLAASGSIPQGGIVLTAIALRG